MTSQETTLSRRTLAKGAAWAAPVVAASAAVPAYAASFSPCPDEKSLVVGAAEFHWGYFNKTTGAAQPTRQQLQLYSRVQMTGIAKDSVESIKIEYVVQQRANGTTYPGAPVPTASGTDWRGTYTATGTDIGLTTKGGATATISNPSTGDTSYFPEAGQNGQAAPIREYKADSTDGTQYTTYTIAVEAKDFTSSYYSSSNNADCSYTFDTGSGSITDYKNLGTPISINWENQTGLSYSNYQSAYTDGMHVVIRYTIKMKHGTTYPTQEYQIPVQPAIQDAYFDKIFGHKVS